MSSKLFAKKNIKNLVIALEIVFLAALAALAVITYRNSRPVSFKTSGMKVFSQDQGVDFKERGVESKASDPLKVVLMDINTGRCYSIPTVRMSKKSLTRQYYDGVTYDDSCFEAKIGLCKEINDSSEYQVLIYLKNSEGKKLVDTQTGVFSWIGSQS